MILLPDYVLKAMNALNQSGYECYVVGGAIRSALLHLPVHDYDLTTNALPEEMKKVFRNWHTFDTGIQHGTITVLSNHHPLEITTYRKDSDYKDHRHPDSVSFTSRIEEDCSRRDFTINALCYHPEKGILDFFHGREDLQSHIIRCIGDPYRRFDEDALRILRAIRFAAQLGFTIEKETSSAILSLKATLSFVSTERINEEFSRYLTSPGCASLFRPCLAVFSSFLPELKCLTEKEAEDLSKQLTEASCILHVRLAVLLSSSCFENPKKVMRRMKYANADIQAVSQLIEMKDRPLQTLPDLRHILRDLKVPFDEYLAYRTAIGFSNADKVRQMYERIVVDHLCCSLKDLAINGKDVMAKGYRGKEISLVLNEILEEVLSGNIPNDRQQLLSLLDSRCS